MLKDTFRNVDISQYTYHDKVFDNEINNLVKVTDKHYSDMLYREAMKSGFYDLQAARDRYRDVTAISEGMNWNLIEKFIEVRDLGIAHPFLKTSHALQFIMDTAILSDL